MNKSSLDSKGVPRTISTKSLKKRRPASRPLGQILRTTDNNFIDFIRRCFEFVLKRISFFKNSFLYFRWDPLERLTPEEGLRHPWIVETKLKRSSRESRTRYRAKKDDNNNNNTSTINGDSCKTNFFFISKKNFLSFKKKTDFSFNETTGHEDTLANEEDKQPTTNNGLLTHFPRISNQ